MIDGPFFDMTGVEKFRAPGLALILGHGLEIGALHEPIALPEGATVVYADAISKEEATRLFPDVNPAQMVPIDYCVNLDTEGLSCFLPDSFDFVVASHVLEHLSNPIKGIREIFSVVRPGGRVLLAVPDMRFTYDRRRELTTFGHLLHDFISGCTRSSDDHYISLLKSLAPWTLSDPAGLGAHIPALRARREHTHVWTSSTFKDFLCRSLELVGCRATPLYESLAEENEFEYFGVWKKGEKAAQGPK